MKWPELGDSRACKKTTVIFNTRMIDDGLPSDKITMVLLFYLPTTS